jgi:hypothetical protein
MSPTRSEYKELGLELVSLEEKISRMPKRPLMVGEKKDDGTGDPFKLLIEESLMQQRNEMMDSFTQILRRLPTGDTSSSSGGTAPFKVQINFDIPIFEGQIDADVVDKWLNLLEGYFSVHNFSNREKITFALLKVIPHVKDWWETFCEKKETEEPSLFTVTTTWESFRDAIKEQYYPVRSYDDLYTKWTTLWQERDQAVPDFTNIFHTLCTKMGIKDSERHLVLKYHGALHRYIQTEMEFLDISSLGTAYRYAIKIEQKLKQKTDNLGLGTPHNKSQERVAPTHRTKDRENMDSIRTTSPSRKQRRTPERQRKIPGSGVTSIRSLGITLLTAAQSSRWWPK